MAAIIRCDGCDFTSSSQEDFSSVGLIIQKEYCVECIDAAIRYAEAVEQLSKDISQQWRDRLTQLREEATQTAEHPLRELPDVRY